MNRHTEALMKQYRKNLPMYEKVEEIVVKEINNMLNENNMFVDGVCSRVKTEKSLEGKLDLKGNKYKSVYEITDLVGVRIVTFYIDDVDKVAALIEQIFDIDRKNSVDKRTTNLDSFGYASLHYICTIPKRMYFDNDMPEINNIPFEVQMRTGLQNVWATINHDSGYKSDFEIPHDFYRRLVRLAGLLEIADSEFSTLRKDIAEHRRQQLDKLKEGKLDDVLIEDLDIPTMSKYLEETKTFRNGNEEIKARPLKALGDRIAATIDNAEIHEATLEAYQKFFDIMGEFGFKTLGDVQNCIMEYSDDVYKLTVYQLTKKTEVWGEDKEISIYSETMGLRNLIFVAILKQGLGELGILKMYLMLNPDDRIAERKARTIVKQAHEVGII